MSETARPEAVTIRPVEVLREQIAAMEASITLIRANSTPRYIHRLRTTTRRIEAQLELLSALPEVTGQFPDWHEASAPVHALLQHFRRAAGKVRDLDVQRDALEILSTHEEKELRKEAETLHRHLGKARKRKTARLLSKVREEEKQLVATFESLLAHLEPVKQITLEEERLDAVTRVWYAAHAASVGQNGKADSANPDLSQSTKELHTFRKHAKLARYIAEAKSPFRSGNEAARTRELASSFESLQERGGTWHDLLTLAKIARRYHGKQSALALYLETQQKDALHRYQEHLNTFAP